MNVDMDLGYIYIPCKISNWDEVIGCIKDEDLDPKEGVEESPHISLMYNLKDVKDPKKLSGVMGRIDEIPKFKVTGLGIFQNSSYNGPNYDVLHYKVESPQALDIAQKIAEEIFEGECDLVDKLHITIGYVKPSQGVKYITKIDPFVFESNKLVYKDSKGDEKKYTIQNVLKETPYIYTNKPSKRKKHMKAPKSKYIKVGHLNEDFAATIGKIKIEPKHPDEDGIKFTNKDDSKDYTFKDAAENKYHENLPQVTAPFHFIVGNLEDLGVDFHPVKKYAGNLKPMQAEVGSSAVMDISDKIKHGHEMDPIWISNDDHICDGHHRAAAVVNAKGKEGVVKAVKIKRSHSEVPHILGRIQDRWEMYQDSKKEHDMVDEFDKHFRDEVSVDEEDRKFSYDDLAYE